MKQERKIYMLVIFVLLCTCVALAFGMISASAELKKLNKFDVNEDGKTNISDVSVMLNYLAKGCEHEAVIDPAVAPTCTETGLTEGRHCALCDEVFTPQEVIPALGHSVVDHVCQRCGKTVLTKGETYTFGSYEQDNDLENGKEEIEWIVLTTDDNKALLLSKYVLDAQPYNTTNVGITWENCTLRKWLNNEFYQAAFSVEEMLKIKDTVLTNDNNPVYGTLGGNSTVDKVFIPSTSDMTNTEYGYSSSLNAKDAHRVCIATTYAAANGCWTSSSPTGGSYWRLRTPGSEANYTAAVYVDGGIYLDGGGTVNTAEKGIRPAIWIDLNND